MENEIIEIRQSDMLTAINRAEVDIQISTAKQYPREVSRVLNQIKTYATMDMETAEDCFYALLRGKDSEAQVIEGISVRLAEIIAGAWGNLRVQTRIIGNDGKTITAQAVCHDLESNLAVSLEVKRRITDKNGRTYSEDMQVVTGNAASAIAYRNAVLKVVPKAVTKKVVNEIKQVALGQSIDLETRRQRLVQYFAQIGVTQSELLAYCEVKTVDQIDTEMVFELRGLANAIKEGTTTVKETFKSNTADSRKIAEEAKKAAETKKRKVDDAMSKATQTAAPDTPKEANAAAAIDTTTGEIITVTEDTTDNK